MKKRMRYILPVIFFGVFVFCLICAKTGCLAETELKIAHAVNPGRADSLCMRGFTEIGEYYGVLAVIAILFIVPFTRKKIAIPTALITAAAYLSSEWVKILIRRERPADRMFNVVGYSFLSGHAISSTALYLSILLLLLPLCKTKAQRVLTGVLCIGLPFAIGFSRIYFGVHYLTDVLAGWSLGAVFAIVGTTLYCKLKGMKTNAIDRTAD